MRLSRGALGGFEQLKRRRTKIVATLGPACADAASIASLIDAGVDVFRMNMSHGDHAWHEAAFRLVRAEAHRRRRPVGLLADLCGPKIRVGEFPGRQVEIAEGAEVVVTVRDVVGSAELIPCQYPELANDVEPGCRMLLADGLLELRVEKVVGTEVYCTIVHGGVLRDHQGINLPDVSLSAPALSEKDAEDARFALELGVDFLALSFVRQAEDILELRALFPTGVAPWVIAKIERPEALDAAEEVIDAADGIMVARGDLGVEVPAEDVPIVQRQLIAKASARGKPTIVATHMLESMIVRAQPTRAEVSDVSTAVFSSADAVMLSAETAAGAYPVEAVRMMDRVARGVESYVFAETRFRHPALHSDIGASTVVAPGEAIARSVAELSRELRARAIVVFSSAGAATLAAGRPGSPVIAVSTELPNLWQMSLLWGVIPVKVTEAQLADPDAVSRRLAGDLSLAAPGEYVLVVTGLGSPSSQSEPVIRVLKA